MQGSANVSYLPALVTGGFAIGGVLIGLLVNFLERSRDRRMTLRKEVYLQAAEAMAGFQEYLANFADPNIPQDKHKEMLKGVSASINKIHVAGEIETIRRFEAAGQFFSDRVFRMSRTRFQFVQKNLKINEAKDYIGRVEESLRGLRAMMQGLQREEPTEENVRQWHATMEIYQQGEGRLNEVVQEHSRLLDERQEIHLRLLKEALESATQFREHLAQANLALRRELKLKLPEKEYVGIMDRGSQSLHRSFSTLMQGIDEDISRGD